MSDVLAVIVPLENVNDESATIIEWKIVSGSKVKKGDVIVLLETMKATFEVEAEMDGFLFYEMDEGAEVSIGKEIAYICKENKRPEMRIKVVTADNRKEHYGNVHISAKAEKLIKEYGLQNEDFAGLEKVKASDVEMKIQQMGLNKKELQNGKNHMNQYVASSEPIEISSAKKFEIRQLGQSRQRVVPSSVSVMVDMQKVKENIKNISIRDGIHITPIELIIHNTAHLLKKHAIFNGFYEGGNCNLYKEINIGFAINIGKGLKVPIICNSDKLSLKEISNSVKELSLKYFREELSLGDLIGGTFTITDLSLKGVVDFYPVINNMQSAILGICSVMPGTTYFKIILTFDHNMADGMVAADMLNELSTLLQG